MVFSVPFKWSWTFLNYELQAHEWPGEVVFSNGKLWVLYDTYMSCDVGRVMLILNIAEILIYNILSSIYIEKSVRGYWAICTQQHHFHMQNWPAAMPTICWQVSDGTQLWSNKCTLDVLDFKLWQHSEAFVAYLEAVQKQEDTFPHVELAFPIKSAIVSIGTRIFTVLNL